MGADMKRGSSVEEARIHVRTQRQKGKMTQDEAQRHLERWNVKPNDCPRWAARAVDMLQSAAEDYIVRVMTESLYCTMHRGAVTITPDDMRLARHFLQQTQSSNAQDNDLVAQIYGGKFRGKVKKRR
jgi:histone H3/H4